MLTVEVASLLWGIAAMVLIWVGLERWQHSLARSRMERLGVGFAGVVELPSEMGLRVLVRSLGDGTEARWPQLGQRLRRGVEAAGVVGLPSVEELLGWKVLGLGLGFVAGLLMVAWVGWVGLAFLVLFVGGGWVGGGVWVRGGTAHGRLVGLVGADFPRALRRRRLAGRRRMAGAARRSAPPGNRARSAHRYGPAGVEPGGGHGVGPGAARDLRPGRVALDA